MDNSRMDGQPDGWPENIMPPQSIVGEGINIAKIIFKNTIFIYISIML